MISGGSPKPPYKSAHQELHYINRSGWLRAAVLGANDGIVSVSSLVVGVAAADPNPSSILIAGFTASPPARCRWRRVTMSR